MTITVMISNGATALQQIQCRSESHPLAGMSYDMSTQHSNKREYSKQYMNTTPTLTLQNEC